jgi:hypothetical protein
MKTYCLTIFLLTSFFGNEFARAGNALVWDQTVLEVYPPVTDAFTKQKFHFVNASDKPVTFTNVETSCGCTTTSMVKTVFAPHERGEVPVQYEFGRGEGFQEKDIVVTTDERPPVDYTLKLKTYIPTVAVISPVSLDWTLGEAKSLKTTSITLAESLKASILEARSTNDEFQVTLKTVKPGTDYTVEVEPRHLNFETRGVVEFTVELEGGERIAKMNVSINSPKANAVDQAENTAK